MENLDDDALLKFFQTLLKDEKEKEILKMVFEDLKEDEIIEKLIQFKIGKHK